MLAPTPEFTCAVFGTNDLASLTGWGGGRVDAAGDYVWNLWRPYQCCRRRGQVFLKSSDWMAYLRELEERRDTVLKSIAEQGKLSPELEAAIILPCGGFIGVVM